MGRTRENNNHWKGGRIDRKGYVSVLMPEHHRADSMGYVSEHILMVEKVLGKPLPEKAVIHHVNETKNDNRNNNFVICEDNAYHTFLHQRMRAYRESGHADWRKCWLCKTYDSPQNLSFSGTIIYHKKCNNERSRIINHNKREERSNGRI